LADRGGQGRGGSRKIECAEKKEKAGTAETQSRTRATTHELEEKGEKGKRGIRKSKNKEIKQKEKGMKLLGGFYKPPLAAGGGTSWDLGN